MHFRYDYSLLQKCLDLSAAWTKASENELSQFSASDIAEFTSTQIQEFLAILIQEVCLNLCYLFKTDFIFYALSFNLIIHACASHFYSIYV